MKGLNWDNFRSAAVATICRNCEYGHERPWRGNTTCLQTWLRFHSSRGLILACNASRAERPARRLEDSLMYEGVKAE